PAPPPRPGDAAFLLAVRRLLRRLQLLVQRPVRSARLGLLLERRDRIRAASAAPAPFHDGLPGASGRSRLPTPDSRLPGESRLPTRECRLPGESRLPTRECRLPGESRIPNPESRVRPAARAVDVSAGPRVGRCTRESG